jgi:hypothetical protein
VDPIAPRGTLRVAEVAETAPVIAPEPIEHLTRILADVHKRGAAGDTLPIVT